MAVAKPVAEVRGPLYIVADNVPKFAIFTAILYMIVVYTNYVTEGALDYFVEPVTQLMIFGAIFCLPLAILDIAFTGLTEREKDIIVMAFVNYFALLHEYVITKWYQIKPLLQWVLYAYLGLFLISLTLLVASFILVRTGGASKGATK